MNQESKNLIYEVINQLKSDKLLPFGTSRKDYDATLISKLETALRDMDKYNGWPNYETWNMHLILSNTQALSNDIEGFLKIEMADYNTEDKPFSSLTNQAKRDVIYEIADSLKEYIQNMFTHEITTTEFNTINTMEIIAVDCEVWTYRDYQEIQWLPIVKAFLEDYLREAGYKEE
ncbi:MAG: hypothetical protein WC365_08780 [Candidatus Babeliales bacterium]|jgi:hypothetical protein